MTFHIVPSGPVSHGICLLSTRFRALSSDCQNAGLKVYVTNDGADVYEDLFRHVASDGEGAIRPTLILLGVRLGIDHVTPVYWGGLRSALQYPQAVGIAGYVVRGWLLPQWGVSTQVTLN